MKVLRENKVLEILETTWMTSTIEEERRKLRRVENLNVIDAIKLTSAILLSTLITSLSILLEKNQICRVKLVEEEEGHERM